ADCGEIVRVVKVELGPAALEFTSAVCAGNAQNVAAYVLAEPWRFGIGALLIKTKVGVNDKVRLYCVCAAKSGVVCVSVPVSGVGAAADGPADQRVTENRGCEIRIMEK